MRAAIQAGVDSLSDGPTGMETVVVMDSGTFGPTDSLEAVDLPSYTELDLRGTIYVEGTGEDLVVPIRARTATALPSRTCVSSTTETIPSSPTGSGKPAQGHRTTKSSTTTSVTAEPSPNSRSMRIVPLWKEISRTEVELEFLSLQNT